MTLVQPLHVINLKDEDGYSGPAYMSALPNTRPMDSLDADDFELLSLSKEIKDALISYEQVAVPIFERIATIETCVGEDFESDSYDGCVISFDTPPDFHLDLFSIRDRGCQGETDESTSSARVARNDKKRHRQQGGSGINGALFDTVRNSVGSILRRASSSLYRIPSRETESAFPNAAPSSRISARSDTVNSINVPGCTIEQDIVEEPADPSLTTFDECRPTETNLGRLVQRGAVKSARRAERALRKTASAGDLSNVHVYGKQKMAVRTQREFHGIMGPEFVC